VGYSQLSLFLLAAAITAWIMVLLPSLLYLATVWKRRREWLISVLGPGALKLYFIQFARTEKPATESTSVAQFRAHFGRVYGRRLWIMPMLIFGVTSGLVIGFVLGQVKNSLLPSVQIVSLEVVTGGLLGAYAWCLVDQWTRFRDQDLSAHDLYGCVVRYIVSAPLALSVASALNPDLAMGVAFLLGAFPIDAVFTIARRVAGQRLGVTVEDEKSPSDLMKLQGIGRINADRFRQEGVTTVAELAWYDPIDLTIRTNMQLNYVIDTISQALLWIYFESDTPKLYRFSLRGAQEVRTLVLAYDYLRPLPDPQRTAEEQMKVDAQIRVDTQNKVEAQNTVKAICGTLGGAMDEGSLLTTLREVADDPYTQFLCNIWT
jgi:hypothetical protein